MRIFLTGATGYIGGAVLDALVKAGHDVTALRTRQREGAARRQSAAGIRWSETSRIRNRTRPRSKRRMGTCTRRSIVRPAKGPEIDRAALDMIIAAAKRPRTSSPATPPDALHHLHVRHLGARTVARMPARKMRRSIGRDRVVGVPRMKRSCSTPHRPRSAPSSSGPASSTATPAAWWATC